MGQTTVKKPGCYKPMRFAFNLLCNRTARCLTCCGNEIMTNTILPFLWHPWIFKNDWCFLPNRFYSLSYSKGVF